MKRHIFKLINWIKERFWSWYEKSSITAKVFAILYIISASICFFLSFNLLDTNPATKDDYKVLEEQSIEVIDILRQDFSLIFELNYDFDIDYEDKILIITFSDGKCSLVKNYDYNLNEINSIEEDNSYLLIQALLISIIVGIFSPFIIVIFLLSLLFVILLIAQGIKFIFNKQKRKWRPEIGA